MKLLGTTAMLNAIRAYARFFDRQKLLTSIFLGASLKISNRGNGPLQGHCAPHNYA
jgi:hypothetical protein